MQSVGKYNFASAGASQEYKSMQLCRGQQLTVGKCRRLFISYNPLGLRGIFHEL